MISIRDNHVQIDTKVFVNTAIDDVLAGLLAKVTTRAQAVVSEKVNLLPVLDSGNDKLSSANFYPRLQRCLKSGDTMVIETGTCMMHLDPTVIDPERIRAVEHSKLAGLQVADAVASGFHSALKVNRYGETEVGYLPHLKQTIYRHKTVSLGYGLKFWPEDVATIKTKAPEVSHLEGL
jgi:hypothetical protein